MKTKFLTVPKAAAEYFGGDLDALVETAIGQSLFMYVRLPTTAFRILPVGEVGNPSEERRAELERVYLHGYRPISGNQATRVLINGSSRLKMVWYRDHWDCTPEQCVAPSFFDVPYDNTRDRQAWFDDATGQMLTRDNAWLSRRQLVRAIEQHFKTREMEPPPQSWPWGNYRTALLDHLAAAVERFWKNYDPEEPDTAETKKTVVEWLVARGVSERTAEQMDTILRVENLPKGPRKKR